MIKKIKSFSSFFLAFLLFFSVLVCFFAVENVKAENCYIVNNAPVYGSTFFDIVRLSNGTLYSIYINSSVYIDIDTTFSLNNGTTWSVPYKLFTGAYYSKIKSCVLSNDTIVIFVKEQITYTAKVYLWTIGNSPTLVKNIVSDDVTYVDMVIDNDNNIHTVYGTTAGNLYYLPYHSGLSSWGSSLLIASGIPSSDLLFDIWVDEYNTVYIPYYTVSTSVSFYLAYKSFSATVFTIKADSVISGTGVSGVKVVTDSAKNIYYFKCYLDGLYIVNCSVYNTVKSLIKQFDVIDNLYNNYLSDVQITTTDKIYIMYYGTGYYHNNVLLKNRIYSGGTIGAEGFITTGGYTSHYGKFVYERFPSNMNTVSGYSVAYKNTSLSGYICYTFDSIYYLDGLEHQDYGCPDFSSYSSLDHTHTIYPYTISQDVTPYLEFISGTNITSKIRGFDFFVSYLQRESDPVLGNYGLYINGLYAGNPVCFCLDTSDVLRLRWDLTSYNISCNDTRPVFELYHDTSSIMKWYTVVTPFDELVYRIPSDSYARFDTSHINGIFEINNYYGDISKRLSPNWVMYYSDYEPVPVPHPSINSIALYDSPGVLLNIHPTYKIPFSYVFKTIFIDTWVNETEKYTLSIFDENNIPVGFSQYFPMQIDVYHKIPGWTPYYYGNYTISLSDNYGYYLNTTVNITDIEVNYAIWTYPNPSNFGSDITIGVYCSNPGLYTGYVVCAFWDTSTDINTITKSVLQINIPSFNEDGFYFTVTNVRETGNLRFRLFATNGTIYFPISGTYMHYMNTVFGTNYITSSLKNNNGFIGTKFYVYGKFTDAFITATVFRNNEVLQVVTIGDFAIDQNIQTPGMYIYFLKVKRNTTWDILSSVSVIISKPSGGQTGAGFPIPIVDPPLSYMLGIAIILLFAMIPLGFAVMFKMPFTDVPILVYVLFACIGLVLSVLLGYIPIWVPFFILIVTLLISVLIYFRGKTNQ